MYIALCNEYLVCVMCYMMCYILRRTSLKFVPFIFVILSTGMSPIVGVSHPKSVNLSVQRPHSRAISSVPVRMGLRWRRCRL